MIAYCFIVKVVKFTFGIEKYCQKHHAIINYAKIVAAITFQLVF